MILHLIYLLSFFSFSNDYEYVYREENNQKTNCYLVVKPKGDIKGLVVRDFSRLPDTSKANPYKFESLCTENNLMTIYVTTSDRTPELYYFEKDMVLLDEIVNEVINKYKIPKHNIFIGGISASGTRALRFAQFCESVKSKYNTKIKGIFSVDSPLDIERFYLSAKTNKKYFKAGMLWEADFVLEKFPQILGDFNSITYQNHSVFSNFNPENSNYKLLLNTSLIFFHEPDIDWWLDERGASYFDINSYDISNIYRLLKLEKHSDVTIITTSSKGFDKNGERKCHSWTIVDEELLANWILDRCD